LEEHQSDESVTTMLEYKDHPLAVRALALLGGCGMTVAPLLSWSITWDIAGRPHREAGLASGFGVVVLAVGIGTLLITAVPRYLPLAILTGLIGGAAAGLYLIDVLAFRLIPDGATEARAGLALALGSAAITGAAGITSLAVATAVSARSSD
jgi:hypothetical protein